MICPLNVVLRVYKDAERCQNSVIYKIFAPEDNNSAKDWKQLALHRTGPDQKNKQWNGTSC